MKQFNPITTKDEDLKRVQEMVKETTNDIQRARILDGNLFESVEFDGGTARIVHNLGRIARWFVVSKDGLGDVYEADTQAAPKVKDVTTLLTDASGGTLKVDLWMF